MISLKELANEGIIEKTGAKPKLPIKIEGVTSDTLDVYRIPLKYLYYNNENGRIAAAMATYQDEIKISNDLENPSYNKLVAKLIENNNQQALKRTQKSISEKGQQVYGWVLDDGRIIDGNRRYTALRNIEDLTNKTQYFEAVVMPFSYSNSAERVKIKQLELAIQMGVEEREKYDPVDLAIDIYRTTGGDNPIMTAADYADTCRMKLKEVQSYYDGAYYIRRFLEFIGAPKTSYDIVKDNKAWTMFETMGKTLSSEFSNDVESQVRKNETIDSYFVLILHEMHVGVVGNTARNHVREYGKQIVKSVDNNEFNEDVADIVGDLSDSLTEAEIKTSADLSKALIQEDDLINEFGRTYKQYLRAAKNSESVEKFIKRIGDNVTEYQEILNDNGLSGSLRYNEITNDQLNQLRDYMRQLNFISNELFEIYGDEIE